ncbi:hypothetical protein [Zavarzinia compransoris]|uniref:hypothetical protein n=1 Tax=Zavarzinia compransoris TaxID=1264899 RepID=UPI0010601BF3|nr:hypothetical protein [Zavarzinia compransoris]
MDLRRYIQTGQVSEWEVEGTSGATVSVGTPELKVELSASYLRMPLKHRGTGRSILYQGVGAGVGVGVSLSIPFVNASGGPDAMPSLGSRIVKGPAWTEPMGPRDFTGRALFVTGSALGPGHSQDVSVVLFARNLPPVLDIALRVGSVTALGPAMQGAAFLACTRGIALVWGLSLATTLGGIGANAIMYQILPPPA